MQKDPLMEFAARPLPQDELSAGVPEQARSVCDPSSVRTSVISTWSHPSRFRLRTIGENRASRSPGPFRVESTPGNIINTELAKNSQLNSISF